MIPPNPLTNFASDDEMNGVGPVQPEEWFAFVEGPISGDYEGGAVLFIERAINPRLAIEKFLMHFREKWGRDPEWYTPLKEVYVLILASPQSVSGNTTQTGALFYQVRLPDRETDRKSE